MKELGIYVHIPFCKKKCDYCDFVSFDNKEDVISNYINKLKREIEGFKAEEDYKVNTIYIGGGTPSYLNCNYIVEIINLIKNKFNIDLKNTEITIEVNPGTVNKEKLKVYYCAGINRLSIGLQNTNNEILKTIGRIHTFEEFLNTYNLAKQVGFDNINIDLMIGLPSQTLANVEETLAKVIELNSKHVSVYSLIIEEDTILKQKIEKNLLALPNEEIERKMYWRVKEKLEEFGYIHYEISNFAKSGYESKHNINCWEQKEYIGFGLAAHSYMNNERFSNTEKLEEYLTSKNSRIIHEKQTKEDKMNEYMLLGLRKIEGIKISDFKSNFTQNPVYIYKQQLDKLVKTKLVLVDKDNIKLTNKGIDLANIVWEEFI